MSWTSVGTVNTDTLAGATTLVVHLPAGVQGGDVITVGVCFTTGGAATTFSLPGFTGTPGLFVGARSATHDQMWGGYRVAAGAAGSATTDTTFTVTFGATVWGEAVTQVSRSTAGAGTFTSAIFNTAAAYQTSCPDPTFTPGTGDLSVWFYAGQNATLGTTATTFSGGAAGTLSNFVQVGITGNGGGVGAGWQVATSAPGGTTANQAVDPTDFVIGVTEAAAPGGGGQARPGQTWLRRFHHRQAPPFQAAPAAVTATPLPRTSPVQARWLPQRGGSTAGRGGVQGVTGPPVRPLAGPVQARPGPHRGGRVTSRAGVPAGLGPAVRPAQGPVRARVPQPVRGGQVTRRAGAYGGLGPAVRALAQAVAGKLRGLPPRGRATGRSGIYAGTGAPVRPPEGPVRAQPGPQRGGRTASRAGTFTQVTLGAGPPVYPLGHPVQARRLPQRGGSTAGRGGTYAQAGPPARAAQGPAAARQPLPARGRVAGRAGTLTVVVTGSGPPVCPLGHPVQARRQPAQGGRVSRRAGTYQGSGAPARPLAGPVSIWRRQPPPPARGRVASRRGPYGGTGPPAVPLRRPVRGQPQKPLLAGRTAGRAGTAVFIPPPPFTVGTLTASTVPATTLTAGQSSSALTAATVPTGTLTAATQTTGGPS